MKINEIIVEGQVNEFGERIKGFANKIAGGIAGAKAGLQASQAARAGAARANNVAKVHIDQWYQATGNRPATPDQLTQFVQKITKGRVQLPAATANDVTPQGAAAYITNAVSQDLSAQTLGTKQPPTPVQAPPAQTPPTTPAATAPAAGSLTGWQKGDTAQATTPATQPNLAQGIKIVSQEPIIMSYNNKQYGLNDKGQWTHLGSNNLPHESFQQFLSQQHDISLGVQ